MATDFQPVDDAQGGIHVVGRERRPSFESRLSRTFLARSAACAGAALLVLWFAEVATVAFGAVAGILVHTLLLVAMITLTPFIGRVNAPLSRVLIALMPAPLIRIVSLTAPILQFYYLQWFTILAAIVFVGITTAIRLLHPPLGSIGLKLPARKHVWLEIAVALSGFALGAIEFIILRPNPLTQALTFRELAAPILIIFVSTGLLEEILFRGLIQRYSIDALGEWAGIAFSVAAFAVMHIGWNSIWDIFFVASVGLMYSLVVRKTGSLLGVSISHAVTNTMLFLVLPHTGLFGI